MDKRFSFPSQIPPPPPFEGPSETTGRLYLSYGSSIVKQKKLGVLLKVLPSFARKEKFVMKGWKSGFGLEKRSPSECISKPPPKASLRSKSGSKASSSNSSQSDSRVRRPKQSGAGISPLTSKEIAAQIKIADTKMKDCVKTQDYAGAGNIQMEMKHLKEQLETVVKEEIVEQERRRQENEEKSRQEEKRRRWQEEEEERRRRHAEKKKPELDDFMRDALQNIKAAMLPHIKAKQYKLCIPLRSDFKKIEALHKRFQTENDVDEWQSTLSEIQDISNRY